MDYVNAYDKVFLAEAVNVFQPFTIYEKSPAMAVRHNPKYISDILLTIFSVVHAFFFISNTFISKARLKPTEN